MEYRTKRIIENVGWAVVLVIASVIFVVSAYYVLERLNGNL